MTPSDAEEARDPSEPTGPRQQRIARRTVVVTPTEAYYEACARELGLDVEREKRYEAEDWWPVVFLVPAYENSEDAELFLGERIGIVVEEVMDHKRDITTRLDQEVSNSVAVHWLMTLYLLTEAWHELGLEDEKVEACLVEGGDKHQSGTHRNLLLRIGREMESAYALRVDELEESLTDDEFRTWADRSLQALGDFVERMLESNQQGLRRWIMGETGRRPDPKR